MAAAVATMNANGFGRVVGALEVMRSNVGSTHKKEAHSFLEQFQKSAEAWTSTFEMLQSEPGPGTVEGQLFAATTLKGKVR